MPIHTDFRPRTLNEFIGNELEIAKLKSQLEDEERPHAYLFAGARGCGKTTLARICTEMVGCEKEDLIEMDIAASGGKEQAKEIKSNVIYKPLFGKVKAYILDEVHEGTSKFFNALLKTLEEPPKHAYFFLCTTEPQKVLVTIKSRCSQFRVEPLSTRQMTPLLEVVCSEVMPETLLDSEDIKKIASVSEGIPREALMILDQVIALPENQIKDAIGLIKIQEKVVKDLCQALLDGKKWKPVSNILKGIKEEPETVRRAVLGYMSTVLLNGTQYAADIIVEFIEPFYNSGRAGLTLACFNCCPKK